MDESDSESLLLVDPNLTAGGHWPLELQNRLIAQDAKGVRVKSPLKEEASW